MDLMTKITTLSPLSTEAVVWLKKQIEHFTFKKNEAIIREGSTCNYLYFINKGLLCGYYITDTKDVCNWIAKELDFATSYYSFISREPSYEYITCLENCTVEAISHQSLHQLYTLFPESERAGRLLLEEYYSRLEERLISMQFKSAKARYEQLFKSRPDIFNRAPLGKVASYLGMSQETLSRLRAEI
jgi:CRP-like cAMP-binding protein